MALIKCPECGRDISDKAVVCPGCGYPVGDIIDSRTDEERIVDEIYLRNPKSMVNAIKELRGATGMDLRSARDSMYIKYKGKTAKELEAKAKAERKAKNKQATANLLNSLQTLSNLGKKDKTARCPKCGSTSIQYTNKKLSLGRALVGDAVAGPTGVVLGGLSSKKGYAVCLKCGKQWKI